MKSKQHITENLDKLGYGLDQSPTVMIRDKKKLTRNRGIPNPSWALIETNNRINVSGCVIW